MVPSSKVTWWTAHLLKYSSISHKPQRIAFGFSIKSCTYSIISHTLSILCFWCYCKWFYFYFIHCLLIVYKNNWLLQTDFIWGEPVLNLVICSSSCFCRIHMIFYVQDNIKWIRLLLGGWGQSWLQRDIKELFEMMGEWLCMLVVALSIKIHRTQNSKVSFTVYKLPQILLKEKRI